MTTMNKHYFVAPRGGTDGTRGGPHIGKRWQRAPWQWKHFCLNLYYLRGGLWVCERRSKMADLANEGE